MRSRLLPLAVLFFMPLLIWANECSLYQVSLSDKITHSDLIVEGEVVAQYSYWNAAQDFIYTANEIEITRVMKGQINTGRVNFITQGGVVGNRALDIAPNLELQVGEKGLFFAQDLPNQGMASGMNLPEYYVYAGPQGMIRFQGTKGFTPFHTYNSLPRLRASITSRTGVNYAPGNTMSPNTNLLNNNLMRPPPPAISNFSPNPATAGTGTVLTINGNGFGATRGSGYVSFANANAGGGTTQPLATQYVSWSNTQIQVIIPSRAGTGPISVTDNLGQTSVGGSNLTITYAVLNVTNPQTGSAATAYFPPLVNENNAGGITWQYATGFAANAPAVAAYERALETWRCETYVNWNVGPTTTVNTVAQDGISAVFFDSPAQQLPAGVLGACFTFRSSCQTTGGPVWYTSERDVAFDDAQTWGYGPGVTNAPAFDFETVALHELGHAHVLAHVINTNAVMHATAAPGYNNRTLLPAVGVGGGQWVMGQSTNALGCGAPPMVPLSPSNCALNSPVAAFSASPTQACTNTAITFTDNSQGTPTSWQWSFPGGTPATSTMQNPVVSYGATGQYDVTLIVSNTAGSDTTTYSQYITISPPTGVTSVGGQDTIFAGNSTFVRFDFTGTAPWTFTWTDGTTTSAPIVTSTNPYWLSVSPASDTDYWINSLSDAGNCGGTASDTASIVVLPAPPLQPGYGLPVWPHPSNNGSWTPRVNWIPGTRDSIPFATSNNGAVSNVGLNDCGQPLFYLLHSGVAQSNQLFIVDTNGVVLNAGNGMNGLATRENQCVRVPNTSNEWYIIYSVHTTQVIAGGNPAYSPTNHTYSRIRYSCDTIEYIQKDIALTATGGTLFTYMDGRAVSQNVPGNPAAYYFYGARRNWGQSSFSLDRWLVTQQGITFAGNTGTVNANFWNLQFAGSPIEVSPPGDRIAVISRNQYNNWDDVFVFDAAAFSNTAVQTISVGDLNLVPAPPLLNTNVTLRNAGTANPQLQFLSNLERKITNPQFSPSSQYLYMSGGGYTQGGYSMCTYLIQIDLNTTFPYDVRVQTQYPPYGTYVQSTGRGCAYSSGTCLGDWRAIGSIQAAFDGNLYFNKRNSDTLWVIPTPDAPMPQGLLPHNVDLSSATYPNIALGSSVGNVPEQMDGFDYVNGNGAKVDLQVSIEGCQGCIATDTTPQPLELLSQNGVSLGCFSVRSCPDTLDLCVNLDSVYSIRYRGTVIDSAIVNGVYNGVLNRFVINYPVWASMDTLSTLCDTLAPVPLTGTPTGGVFSGPGVTGNTFDPGAVGPGTYRLYYTVTDPVTLCFEVDSIEVDVEFCCGAFPGTASATADSVDCFGGSDGSITVSVAGGNAPFQYELDNNGQVATPVFTGLSAAQYTITVWDSAGCDTNFTVDVFEPTDLQVTVTSTLDPSCNGLSDGAVTLNGFGGSGPRQYSDDGVTFTANSTLSGLAAGTYWFYVQDANGCLDSVQATLTDPPLLAFGSTTSADVSCFGGADGSISATANGGTPAYEFSLDGVTWQASGNFNGLAAGAYTVYLRDANNCQTTLTLTLAEPTEVVLTNLTGTDITCFGANDGTLTASATGGTGTLEYSTNGGISWQSNATFSGLGPGQYTVTVRDDNNCQATATFTLNEPPAVVLDAVSITDVTCPNGSDGRIQLSATGGTPGYEYSNNGGATWQNSSIFSNLSEGTYTCSTRDANGCTTDLTVIIEVGDGPLARFTHSRGTCENPSLVIFSNGSLRADTYQWDFGDGNTSTDEDPAHLYDQPGTYTVTLTATNSAGCTDTEQIIFTLEGLPVAAFSSDPDIPSEKPSDTEFFFTNESQNAVRYEWDFGDGYGSRGSDPSHVYEREGEYCVTLYAYNQRRCVDSTQQCLITIKDGHLFIPSAFTPNGDGLNDEFEIVTSFTLLNFDLAIFDRWGELIYQTNDHTGFWDGTYEGQPVQEGVYTWRVQATSSNGFNIERAGTVTLIR